MARRTLWVSVTAVAIAIVLSVGALAGGRPLSAALSGAEEAPGPGDPDGSGAVTLELNQGQGTVCWEIALENVDPLPPGGHIHQAPAGEAGDIVLTLFGSPANAGPTTTPAAPSAYPASACIENASAELIKAIRQDPHEYYVNLHNSEFPAGAVRGQLSK